MFVVSLKRDNIKKIIVGALIAVIVIVGVYFLLTGSSDGEDDTATKNGISMKAADNKDRIAFLSQFGWEVTEDPIEVSEVIIPDEFDETYEKYNEIQKEQNLDLSGYKGKRVKKWTYEIKNYPSHENSDGIIRANILVFDGVVIGGDVCSIELDGFMHTFAFPDKQTVKAEENSNKPVQSETDSMGESKVSTALTSDPSVAQSQNTEVPTKN